MAKYLSSSQWGAKQEPPITGEYAASLAREGRIEPPPVKVARDYLFDPEAKRLPPTEKSREKWRTKMSRYHARKKGENVD